MKKTIKSIVLLLIIVFLLVSCGNKSYVVFNYNCNGTDYHKCELKNNKLNCSVETPSCGEYKFKGWFRANEYNNPVDLSSNFTKNEIIYARWEKESGIIESSSRVEPTSTIVTPGTIDIPSSSKEEPSSSQQQVTPPTPVNPPKPEETYTISFNLNGGTGGQTSPISGVKYNNDLPKINQTKPTKPGYTFMGWYDKTTGGTQYYNSSNSPVRKYDKKGNITLYAHWTINTLSIQYNGNGGTWANPSKDTYGVNSSNTVIVKSTNQVYQQQLNYGAKLDSSGLVDYNGSWFKWTRSGYTVESKKEYIIGSTVLEQSKSYSAVELSRYAGCDLSKTDCTITVKVNWKKDVWNINKDYGTGDWVYYKKNSDAIKNYFSNSLAFAEYVPEKATSSGDSLPLIVWLHGSGERGCSEATFKARGLLIVVSEWKDTGLKNIPAIIIAPQLYSGGSWGERTPLQTIQPLIEYAKDRYNINTNMIVLMGHSLGGNGVYYVSKSNQELFSALVMLSGYIDSPSKDSIDYFKRIPIKGYTERSDGNPQKSMNYFFSSINKLDELTTFNKGIYHGQVPKAALIEDKNNDKVSDLIYWALSQQKK